VSKSNPTVTGTNTEPILYDFSTARLKIVGPNQFRSQYFLSYIDQYGLAPYAYFSSWGGQGYNRYLPYFNNLGVAPAQSDCITLVVTPYSEMANGVPTGKYMNKDNFQIISAGYDGVFGPGGPFDPSVGIGLVGPGVDDMTNFHPTVLGGGTK
jgi:hypothetical protein